VENNRWEIAQICGEEDICSPAHLNREVIYFCLCFVFLSLFIYLGQYYHDSIRVVQPRYSISSFRRIIRLSYLVLGQIWGEKELFSRFQHKISRLYELVCRIVPQHVLGDANKPKWPLEPRCWREITGGVQAGLCSVWVPSAWFCSNPSSSAKRCVAPFGGAPLQPFGRAAPPLRATTPLRRNSHTVG